MQSLYEAITYLINEVDLRKMARLSVQGDDRYPFNIKDFNRAVKILEDFLDAQ